MPTTLDGSCRCGTVSFSVESHTPHPYMRCYCGICRKTAGGGGYAINLGADSATMKVTGREALSVYRAKIEEDDGTCRTSSGERSFCGRCASALWVYDPGWPELIHPFASAMDSALPMPPETVHIMLRYKPAWVVPAVGPKDVCFDEYPEESIADWHRARDLWVS